MEQDVTPPGRQPQLSFRLPADLKRQFKVYCANKPETITECLTRLIRAELGITSES